LFAISKKNTIIKLSKLALDVATLRDIQRQEKEEEKERMDRKIGTGYQSNLICCLSCSPFYFFSFVRTLGEKLKENLIRIRRKRRRRRRGKEKQRKFSDSTKK
jgi:hypothetical protein